MYENSRFLKNRFTFCGVNTHFGQQWAPPAYYHLTPIVSKGKHWTDIVLSCRVFTPQPSGLEGYCRHGTGGRAVGQAAARLAEPIAL